MLEYGDGQLLKRVLRSIAALFAGQSLNTIGNLLLVPLFLSRWPKAEYGEWLALSAVVACFGVTDLGMNSAAANALTTAYARRDLTRFRFLQGSAMAFYVGIALSVSALLGCLIVLFPIPNWIGVRQIPLVTASCAVWVLTARILWQMPAAQVSTIYRATGNLAATQWFGNLQALGVIVVTVAVLLFHGGVLQLALWGSAPLVVVTFGVWRALRRSHPELLPKLSAARIAGVRELMSPSLMFGLIMISVAVTTQGPILLVSRALGGGVVALLVTTRTLGNVIRTLIGTLNVALWPELTRLDATGSAVSLRLNHRLLAFSSTALCASFAGALWFEGGEVISIWTQGRLTPDIWLLRLFLLALVLQAPWLASSVFTAASNRHGKLSCSYAVSAVLTLAATAILLRPCGVLAVPLGAILGEALACYHFVPKDTCAVLDEDYRRFAVQLWIGVAAMLCAAWGAAWVGHSIAVGPAPVRWLEVGALTTLAASISGWYISLRRDDRTLLVRWGISQWSRP